MTSNDMEDTRVHGLGEMKYDGDKPNPLVETTQNMNGGQQDESRLKQTMKDLQESQKIAKIGTWRLDLATNEVVWSEQLYKMYGFDPTGPVPPYTQHMKLFTPESWDLLSRSLERTRTTGIPYELQLKTVKADESNGWMWVRGEAERDSTGAIVSLWGVAQDITAFKRAELEAKESEEKFRYVFDNSPVGKSLTLLSGEINVNNTFCRMLGFLKEELQSKNWREISHPDEIEYTQKVMNRLLAREINTVVYNKRFRKKDGSYIWTEIRSSIRWDSDGRPLYFLTNIMDITERKRSEAARRQLEERYRTLFNQASVGICTVALDGKIIDANHKICEFFGYTLSELKELTIVDMTHPSERAQSSTYVSEISKGNITKYSTDKRYIRKNGDIVWGSLTVSVIKDELGNPLYFNDFVLDIDEKKRAEQKLEIEKEFSKEVLENLNSAVVACDAQGKLTLFNRIAREWHGLDAKAIPPEEWPKYYDLYDGNGEVFLKTEEIPLYIALNGETFQNIGMAIARTGKDKRFISANGSPMVDKDGNIIGAVVVMHDITKERADEKQIRESNERLKRAVEEAPFPIMLHAEDGEIIQLNRAWQEISGYTFDEIPTTFIWTEKVYGTRSAEVQASMKKIYALKKREVGGTYIVKTKEGAERVWNFSAAPLGALPDGRRLAMSMAHDITELKNMERSLFEEKERLQITFNSIGDGVITTDIDRNVVMLNAVAEKLTGWTIGEAKTKQFADVFKISITGTEDRAANPVDEVLRTDTVRELANHTVLTSRDGTQRHVADTAAPIKDAEGNTTGVVMVFRDVTERKQYMDEISYLSYHDYLTGLYNRAFFIKEMARLDSYAQLPISIIMGDVNGLKLLNDVYGHEAGDGLLKRIARILKQKCPERCVIARWGGDEFTVLLPQTAELEAKRIYDDVVAACTESVDTQVVLSISLGTSTKIDSNTRLDNTLRDAEDKMYTHKLVEGKSVRSAIISSLQKSLYEKSFETEEHAVRMMQMATMFGAKLMLSHYDMDKMRLLTLLHDVEK